MENPFANPFPGMNPYLESRRLWPEVHNKLIGEMHRFLRRTLPFRYTVIMDERVGIGNTLPEIRRRDTLSLIYPSEEAEYTSAHRRPTGRKLPWRRSCPGRMKRRGSGT